MEMCAMVSIMSEVPDWAQLLSWAIGPDMGASPLL